MSNYLAIFVEFSILLWIYRYEILFLQRQALIQYKVIPDLVSKIMLKCVLYWSVPLLFYFGCMYVVAFCAKSLSISIFIMGITLHPFVAVPFAVGVNYLLQICSNLFAGKENNVHKNQEKRNLSFSIILFIAFLTLNQLYLFNNWMNFREEVITQKCQPPPQNVTLEDCHKSFGAYSEFGSLLFDQCNCTAQFELTGDENVCVNTDPVYNIENFLDLVSSKATSYLLLGYALSLILLHFVEYSTPCLSPSIPLDIFILGPSFEQRINEQECSKNNELSSNIIKLSTRNRTWNYLKSVSCRIDMFYLVVSIVFIVGIYCSVFGFEGFYNWKQFRCNPGFYDALPDPDIIMCLSKFIRGVTAVSPCTVKQKRSCHLIEAA